MLTKNRRLVPAVVLALALAGCGGSDDSGDSTGAAGGGGSEEFCELGFRIGDTGVLVDVDHSSPAAHESSYTKVVTTMRDLIPLSPDSAKGAIEAGHAVLVDFQPKLEAVAWDQTKLPSDQTSEWINLGEQLIPVSPAIRNACS